MIINLQCGTKKSTDGVEIVKKGYENSLSISAHAIVHCKKTISRPGIKYTKLLIFFNSIVFNIPEWKIGLR